MSDDLNNRNIKTVQTRIGNDDVFLKRARRSLTRVIMLAHRAADIRRKRLVDIPFDAENKIYERDRYNDIMRCIAIGEQQ